MLKFIKDNSYDIFKMLMNQIGLTIFGLIMTVASARNDSLFLIMGIFSGVFYLCVLYALSYDLGSKDKPAIDAGRRIATPYKGALISLCANLINILCGIFIVVFSFFLLFHPSINVLNESGEPVQIYNSQGEQIELYSNSGDDAYTVSEGNISALVLGDDKVETTVYNKNGDEIKIYNKNGETLYTTKIAADNWAANLYAIPLQFSIFFQAMYAGIRFGIFNNADWFFLISPLPAIITCGIAYYFGSTGKRIFFFIPERKRRVRR